MGLGLKRGSSEFFTRFFAGTSNFLLPASLHNAHACNLTAIMRAIFLAIYTQRKVAECII